MTKNASVRPTRNMNPHMAKKGEMTANADIRSCPGDGVKSAQEQNSISVKNSGKKLRKLGKNCKKWKKCAKHWEKVQIIGKMCKILEKNAKHWEKIFLTAMNSLFRDDLRWVLTKQLGPTPLLLVLISHMLEI